MLSSTSLWPRGLGLSTLRRMRTASAGALRLKSPRAAGLVRLGRSSPCAPCRRLPLPFAQRHLFLAFRAGNVMGGYDQLGQGEYLEKTFHNLPVHKGITLSLRYLFIDTWCVGSAASKRASPRSALCAPSPFFHPWLHPPVTLPRPPLRLAPTHPLPSPPPSPPTPSSPPPLTNRPRDGDEAGLIYVDGELISQPVHNQYPSSSYCGQSGNADNIADLVFHLPDHVSHTLTLRIGSTLSSGKPTMLRRNTIAALQPRPTSILPLTPSALILQRRPTSPLPWTTSTLLLTFPPGRLWTPFRR